MALIKCKECGRGVSDKATTCPHCGVPIEPLTEQEKEKNKPLKAKDYIIGTLFLFAALLVISSFFKSEKPPAQPVAAAVAAPAQPALKTFSSPAEVLKFFRHYDEADGNIKVVSSDPFKVEVWEGDFWNEVGTPKNDLFLKRMLVNNLYLLFYHTPLDHITLTVYARSADNANLDKPRYSISISRQKALDVAKEIFQVTDYTDLFKIYEYDTDVNVMDLDSHRYIETVNDTDKLNQLIKALGVSVVN